MSKYRSALGKVVDMGALTAKNEKVRAVGNGSVNARGDTIDAHGRIIKSVNEKVTDGYAKTVGNKSANPVKRPIQAPVKPTPPIELEELTMAEKELEDSLEDDLEVEKIKQEEIKKQNKQKR